MSAQDTSPSELPGDHVQTSTDLSWSAGIINHGTYGDLERCLTALSRQSLLPSSIVVYDTGAEPTRYEALRLKYPNADWQSGGNLGYAGGANQVIKILEDKAESSEFILILNPDVELENDYGRCLIQEMVDQPQVAIATGKLLRHDRRTLDSAGITIPRNRRPRDRGSDQRDAGQFDNAEYVDAASGAAMMLRAAALDDLRIEGELFDESFFAYHEDTDLCWRARLFGWQILYEPRAVAIHQRGWQRGRRFEIPTATRRHSFKNHYLQLAKNDTIGHIARDLPWLFSWEILRLGFVLLKDPAMLTAYLDAYRNLPGALRKRRLIHTRVQSP